MTMTMTETETENVHFFQNFLIRYGSSFMFIKLNLVDFSLFLISCISGS